ncbi:MAG: monovalent cation/H(+) antiporter subunit G [Alphaproteobacteria bacterium]|jgi:multicomponent K+:H+ antiporter subunit G|uniref:monovalent cation/H(+) antiporter subunit G n=1 Tax=Devosia sp. XGJD_8 TaxID=3391187 RepID=UPI001D3E3787|nr:monovalent cation/H(+) antiporter subunit G [Alphaproteobacteria bacterium]MBU1560339.1 monovalent cation/H(+) antiporter subunit G [Alphaproteobacteria bacterium]MBU2303664.1 monovalent cation/H(+) antiporter subunit G [Alphaproteobacteria bacterium]MBU2366263.1 monovalent cation/H(+) antiporter subunit G [Alphaproteobacteria bacterium]
MTDIPVWLAIVVGLLSLAGALLTLVGCIGLARFESFYERIHAPTLGTSFGTVAVLLASILYFSVTGQRPAIHEVLLLVFVSVTTPVTLMLLARAALYRDRAERNGTVPPSVGQDIVVPPTDAKS